MTEGPFGLVRSAVVGTKSFGFEVPDFVRVGKESTR